MCVGKAPGHVRFATMTILYLMAAQAEFGAMLQKRIQPVFIGVGPVEAAVNTTRALQNHPGGLPGLVVSLGSAGSRTLDHCGLYQASSVAYRDMDASALGFPKGQTPFLDLPAVLPLPTLPGLPTATLSTGANVVSGAGYDDIEAEMVDMETYAVLRSCQSFAVPLIALRGISDGVTEISQLSDWTEYLHVIDVKLALAIDLIETAHADGLI